MNRFLRSITLLALAPATLLMGCGSDDPTGPPQSGLVEIDLLAQSFSPAQVEIEPGTTVRWTNTSATEHTITPTGHEEWNRVVMTTSGQTFEHTFDEVGEFPYHCEPHQAVGMVGEIRVVEP